MTTEREPTLEEAKAAAAVPPEVIPDAVDLPDEVRNGELDAGEDDPTVTERIPTTED